MRALYAAGVFCIAAAAPALADGTADAVRRAALATFHTKSLHMSIVPSAGPAMEIDMIPVSRIHATIPGGMEFVKIDGDVYLKVHGGWRKMHVPGLGRLSEIATNGEKYANPDTFTARDAGTRTVGGEALHAYDVSGRSSNDGQATMLVGADGLIHRMEVRGRHGSTTIIYSKFNAPLAISPPI